MLWHVSGPHPFLLLNNISCIDTPYYLFIYLSVGGHMGCSAPKLLWIILWGKYSNEHTNNIWVPAFNSVEYIPEVGLLDHMVVYFSSNRTILNPTNSAQKVLISLHPCQCLVFSWVVLCVVGFFVLFCFWDFLLRAGIWSVAPKFHVFLWNSCFKRY